MISTDMKHTGAGTATPPAVGLSAADRVVVTSPAAALSYRTGLPVVGTASPIRLRGLIAAAGTTGSLATAGMTGSFATGVAVPAPTVQPNSTTPGDLPPEDPPSQ